MRTVRGQGPVPLPHAGIHCWGAYRWTGQALWLWVQVPEEMQFIRLKHRGGERKISVLCHWQAGSHQRVHQDSRRSVWLIISTNSPRFIIYIPHCGCYGRNVNFCFKCMQSQQIDIIVALLWLQWRLCQILISIFMNMSPPDWWRWVIGPHGVEATVCSNIRSFSYIQMLFSVWHCLPCMLHQVKSVSAATVTSKAGLLEVFVARDLFNCKINFVGYVLQLKLLPTTL